MIVATKKGDTGFTDLKNTRVSKCDNRIEALGMLDTCMSEFILFATQNSEYLEAMETFTKNFSIFSAILAGYLEPSSFEERQLFDLEKEIDAMSHQDESFQFIYPFHNQKAALLNRLRTLVRKTEIAVWNCQNSLELDSTMMSYLNRCSDWFYLKSLEIC